MKVLAKYDDGDSVLASIYVCELSEEEMICINPGKVKAGDSVEVPNLIDGQRAIDKQFEKALRILANAKRYQDLLAMLTLEIEQARLAVSFKEIPDLNTARALTCAIEHLLNG